MIRQKESVFDQAIDDMKHGSPILIFDDAKREGETEYRGKGLAKALFQHIEDIAKQRGYEKIVLEVREHNREAIGLYEKLGFKKKEFLKNYYSEKLNGSRNAFRMEKRLIE